MHARARLSPANVGLPETGRRRVPGLRREEVAELVGISADWYRLFESGRAITVSPQLIERLAHSLGLDAFAESALFRLALPELYRTELIASMEPPTMSLIVPVRSLEDVEDVRRNLIVQREHFLTGAGGEEQILRPRILNSWKRSQDLHVDAGRAEASRVAGDGAGNDSSLSMRERLLRESSSILAHLENTLAGIGYAVVLADAEGTIIDIRCERDVRRKLERVAFERGTDWSEAGAGTNAIGTALSDDRPLQLMAAEHYCEGWQDLTCTAAPIHDPRTGDVVGILDITGDYRLVRPQLLGTIVQYALEIEERLAVRSRSGQVGALR
ncbi:MAG TPA: helix-turn-helix domain-containing protein [Candidatus Elarobacter sp.]|jgi:transcriptional regulator with XRE-family HTH domain|nr:helix-turn-helix domain-containing protein [Candidatus Elarobacter sp.]